MDTRQGLEPIVPHPWVGRVGMALLFALILHGLAFCLLLLVPQQGLRVRDPAKMTVDWVELQDSDWRSTQPKNAADETARVADGARVGAVFATPATFAAPAVAPIGPYLESAPVTPLRVAAIEPGSVASSDQVAPPSGTPTGSHDTPLPSASEGARGEGLQAAGVSALAPVPAPAPTLPPWSEPAQSDRSGRTDPPPRQLDPQLAEPAGEPGVAAAPAHASPAVLPQTPLHRGVPNALAGREVAPPIMPIWPPTGRRTFDVFLGEFGSGIRVASIDYVFEHDERTYRLRTEARATGVFSLLYGGLLTQSSRGRLGPEGLLPEHYLEKRGDRAARFVDFDRATGLAKADDGATQALDPSIQDQLSVMWQLALIARNAPERLRPGHEMRWSVARGRRLHAMRIVAMGDEILQAGAGPALRSIHLTLIPVVQAEEGQFDVWLSRDQAMQPIRMRMAPARGQVIDQIVRTGP